MLPKVNRISKEKDVKRALRSRFGTSSDNYKLLLQKNRESNFRFLCVVSKKISKKANKRNRIKRKLYAVVEDYLKNNTQIPNFDCVIIVTNYAILKKTSLELKEQFSALISILSNKVNNIN